MKLKDSIILILSVLIAIVVGVIVGFNITNIKKDNVQQQENNNQNGEVTNKPAKYDISGLYYYSGEYEAFDDYSIEYVDEIIFSEDNTFIAIQGGEALYCSTGTYVNNNGNIVLKISKRFESDGCTESVINNDEIYTLKNGNLIGTAFQNNLTYTLKKVNLSDASIDLLECAKLVDEKYHKAVCK